jgi:uncharacterized repeat protein (TIGR04138 family)
VDGRFDPEGLAFVGEGLRHQVEHVAGGDPTLRRHLSAAELVEGVVDLAARRFGMLGDLVLAGWGLRQGDDVGAATFLLIEHGVFSRQDEDRREDFALLPALGPAIQARVRTLAWIP